MSDREKGERLRDGLGRLLSARLTDLHDGLLMLYEEARESFPYRELVRPGEVGAYERLFEGES